MIELKIPDGLLDLKKRHRDLLKNGIKKALKNYRKAKAMCDKPKPIETDEGTYYPSSETGFDNAYHLMKKGGYLYICENTLYRYNDQSKFFEHYLESTNQWFALFDIFMLYHRTLWSTRFEPKAKDYTLRLGDVVCFNDEKLVVKYNCLNNKNPPIGVIDGFMNNLSDKGFYLAKGGQLVSILKINPSQERKEMELLSGRKYENKEIKESFVFISGFYGEKVYFTKPLSNVEMSLTRQQFKEIYKEWTEPRTLKLEDLNKLWKDKEFNRFYQITGFDNKNIFYKDMTNLYHPIQSMVINTFFDRHREATQSDLDNLTKGN